MLLEKQRPQGSANNDITVIFDGKSDVFGRHESPTVQVIFSKDESADDVIRRLVEKSINRKNIIVVTNDRSLQYAVRALGAQTRNVEKFLKQLNLYGKSAKHRLPSEKKEISKNIPKKIEQEINSELENIWIKKDQREEK